MTQKVYAHLSPDAWEQDYHRLAFTLPSEGAVYALTKRVKRAQPGAGLPVRPRQMQDATIMRLQVRLSAAP